jgi:EAL domain-containing protein (putative c-di-GMP-specific phosphodiesterase class I)
MEKSVNLQTNQPLHLQTPEANESEVSNDILVDLSHELRTPLTAIQCALELLSCGKLGNLSVQAQQMVDIAAKNADRLLRLTTVIEGEPEAHLNFLSAAELAQLRFERELKLALIRKEFQLYYQPIVSLQTKKITGFEALIRWMHPHAGIIPPNKFIPLAEANGFIVEIGSWVLQEACSQLKSWQDDFPEDFHSMTVSVNISSKHFTQKNVAQEVEQILRQTGLPARNLVLEITESAMVANPVVAKATLEKLQSLGVRLYIDDFGTGYSSLSRLYELPLDVLKIDRSFVEQLNYESGEHLVKAITNLAHNLGLEVIAEGIETLEQISKLESLGCTKGQGFFFAEPVDNQSISNLISRLSDNILE